MLPELKTERLILRELAPAHAKALQELMNAQRDDGGVSSCGEKEDAATRIANYTKHRGPEAARRFFVYAAFSRNELVGTVSLVRPGHRGIANIGLFVGEAYEGRGFATEIVRRIVTFGFAEQDINRIEADVEIGNVASQRVMERAGLRREGVMRDCTWARGRWWTDIKYAILARDLQATASRGDAAAKS